MLIMFNKKKEKLLAPENCFTERKGLQNSKE